MEQSKEYTDYIRSDRWAAKAQERIEIDGHKCVMCGRPEYKCRNGLQVHHVTYVRLGREDVFNDLVSLCRPCHLKIHAYYNRRRGMNRCKE